MGENGVLVFPDAAKGAASSIDPNLLLALQNGGGFGNGGSWLWILFLWMMWSQNGRNGNFNDYVAQMGNQGQQYLAEIMNGRFDNLNTLAQIINSGVETVKSGIFALQNSINQVGASVGLTAAQTQNAIALGNAGLSRQLCECCCNIRHDLAQQTNALQAQAANNFASTQLQSAQNQAATQLQLAQQEAASRLSVCQQTNTLTRQADDNTNSILTAIQNQNTMITKEFCALKERELQNKIDTQADIITQMRNQISEDHQTIQFNNAFQALDNKVDAIAAKQPATTPVIWPNLQAINTTPNVGYNPWGYGHGGTSYWG